MIKLPNSCRKRGKVPPALKFMNLSNRDEGDADSLFKIIHDILYILTLFMPQHKHGLLLIWKELLMQDFPFKLEYY